MCHLLGKYLKIFATQPLIGMFAYCIYCFKFQEPCVIAGLLCHYCVIPKRPALSVKTSFISLQSSLGLLRNISAVKGGLREVDRADVPIWESQQELLSFHVSYVWSSSSI